MFQAPTPALHAVSLTYSSGLRGIKQTVGVMREFVKQGRIDPIIRSAATSLIWLEPEKDPGAEILAIFDFVQNRIRYVSDINEVETISTAAKTLQGQVGDCDDKSILLAALFETVGYPTRFVVTGYGTPGELEHVYVQVLCSGEWIDADATEPHPLGWAAPDYTTIYIESV